MSMAKMPRPISNKKDGPWINRKNMNKKVDCCFDRIKVNLINLSNFY